MMVYTTRFFPEEVVGKTVVIHDMPDDFRTQPSGNSGEKIACGQIVQKILIYDKHFHVTKSLLSAYAGVERLCK